MYELKEKTGERNYNFVGSVYVDVQDASTQEVMNCFMHILEDIHKHGKSNKEYTFTNEEGDTLTFSDFLDVDEKENGENDLSQSLHKVLLDACLPET